MSFRKALCHLKQLVSEAQYKLASRKGSPIVNRRLKSVDFDSQGSLLRVWHCEGVEVLGNSPGLGPGRVRSLTGLVNFPGIGIGEGLPSPLTPLPWASGPENCRTDPLPKVVMRPFLAQLKPPKTPYVSHFWPPRGGREK